MSITTHLPTGHPEVINFRKAFFDKYSREPDALAGLAYDATNLIIESIFTAGTTDPNFVADKIANISFSGVTGVVTFGAYHNPIKSTIVMGVDVNGDNFIARIDS